VTTSRAKNVDS